MGGAGGGISPWIWHGVAISSLERGLGASFVSQSKLQEIRILHLSYSKANALKTRLLVDIQVSMKMGSHSCCRFFPLESPVPFSEGRVTPEAFFEQVQVSVEPLRQTNVPTAPNTNKRHPWH